MEMVRRSVPAARTTMPEVGFIEERWALPDERTGETAYLAGTVDANDPAVRYRFVFGDRELDRFPGRDEAEKLAAAVDHMDRCAKAVFN
jgi:hypothetical protein